MTSKKKQQSKNICGARRKKDGNPCTRPAGWGTYHPGIGKCKLHGGSTPFKHGLHSQYFHALFTSSKLEPYQQELLENEDQLNDLRVEIIKLRTILVDIETRWREGKIEVPEHFYKWSGMIIEKISDVVEKRNRIKYGQKLQVSLSPDQIRNFMNKVIRIIKEEVKDANTVRRIVSRIGIKSESGS